MNTKNTKSAQKKQAPRESQPATVGDSMDRYKTRDKANVPKRVFLYDPATKAKTEDWLDVRSSLSDDFREARDEAMQRASEIAQIANDGERKEALDDSLRAMYASLIAAWSFDKPCTEQNKKQFLLDAPQIRNMVMAVADDSEAFFAGA